MKHSHASQPGQPQSCGSHMNSKVGNSCHDSVRFKFNSLDQRSNLILQVAEFSASVVNKYYRFPPVSVLVVRPWDLFEHEHNDSDDESSCYEDNESSESESRNTPEYI